MMMMLRKGGLSKLRAFKGGFDSKLTSFLYRSVGNFSTGSPPSSLVAWSAAADRLMSDDPPGSAVKPRLEPMLLQPGVIIYDGVCHLCHRGVKWVIKADKDKKIKFCCLQSKAAEPYMRVCGVDREDVLRRFLFIEGPGLYHQGSSAALKVMSYLPFPYSALSSLLIVPAPLRDVVYDFVARRRYKWFGKSTDCLVLKEKELLDRFIDWEELLHRSAAD